MGGTAVSCRRSGTSALLASGAALLAGAGALLTMGAVPASASGSVISIVHAGPTDGNPALLTVVAADSNDARIISMTVHLYSGRRDVYDVTDMKYESESGGYQLQTWQAAAAIKQADLPPGTYTMTVDAADKRTREKGLATPQPLAFVYATRLTATSNAATVSYDDTTVSVAGQVTGVPPGAGSAVPVGRANVAVYLQNLQTSYDTRIATTSATGSYSAQVQLPSASSGYAVLVAASRTWAPSSERLPVTWARDPTRVSATVTPEDFDYGGTRDATLSGTASYSSGGSWRPLADHRVLVGAGRTAASVTTTSTGRFTWVYRPSDGTRWRAVIDGGSQLGSSSASGVIHLAAPLSISGFTVSLNPFAELSASGCVRVTAGDFPAPSGQVDIQYSVSGATGPWTLLRPASLAPSRSGDCRGPGESYFSGSMPVVVANAFYRAYFAATPSYQAAASRAVYRWKYVTRIVSLKISPGSVAPGGKVKVSGWLQQYVGGWRKDSRQPILIILRPQGKKAWYLMQTVTTAADGRFTATVPDPASGTWSAEYAGDSTHFACLDGSRYVRLRGSRHRASAPSRRAAAFLGTPPSPRRLPPS